MGSSSAFAVGLLKALHEISKKSISKKGIAYKAIELERDILGEYVGSQDQVAAAYGGFNRINFKENHKIEVNKINVDKTRLSELDGKLMLFYTGLSRFASEIAESIVKRTDQNRSLLLNMQNIVDEANSILISKTNLSDFGELLDESWHLKRKLSESVSSPKIDEIYKIAKENGALGGKILGAGGAGFMLFYVDQKHQIKIREALRNLLYVPFKFSNSGTRIIYNDNKDKFIKIS
jgi:D-glycero-alpha-D-manno-heptose-7-phosphate kinase